MITALNAEYAEKGRGLFRLINSLRPDSVNIELRRARGVCLKYVTYKTYSGRIKLDKLDSAIGSNRSRLLCSSEYKFPQGSGYMRFCSNEFAVRLCTNMAYEAIKKAEHPEIIKVGIYDPKAVNPDLLLYVLEFCSDVVAVTNESRVYNCQLSRALDEFGASAVITNRTEELSDRDIVIAPTAIKIQLPIRSGAILLTIEKPKVQQSGLVYFRYHFRMPNGFANIKPSEFDEVYFCSALYTLENQYELGSIVPSLCSNENCSQTVSSLSAYLSRND